MTEPVLTVEIEGEGYLFMVDTGAMVSLIQPGLSKAQTQPCDIKARGVTGTQLNIIGEQEVTFNIKPGSTSLTFIHTFVVSPLKRCSPGILGMDFLQRVGAEISLTTQSLNTGRYSFPLKSREQVDLTVQRLINAELGGSPHPDSEEKNSEPVEDWEGTVELAETVTVPPLSVRIARCRVVRRDDSTVIKVPRNQEVLVDPEGLPGVYLARIVATLNENMSSSNAGDLPPFMVNKVKSPLVEFVCSPYDEEYVNRDDSRQVALRGGSISGSGTGECLPRMMGGGLPVAATDHRDDLQLRRSPLPVEVGIGIQVDTTHPHAVYKEQGQDKLNEKGNNENERNKGRQPLGKIQILGCVPVQVANLSLEEITLEKWTRIGVPPPYKRTSQMVMRNVT